MISSSASISNITTMDTDLQHKFQIDLCKTLYSNYISAAQNRLNSFAVYVSETDTAVTHKEFINYVDAAANGFAKLGVTYGTHVGLLLNGSIEDAATFLALNKLGA